MKYLPLGFSIASFIAAGVIALTMPARAQTAASAQSPSPGLPVPAAALR